MSLGGYDLGRTKMIGGWICLISAMTFCIFCYLGIFSDECSVLPIGSDMVRSCFSQIVALKSSGPEVRQSDTWGPGWGALQMAFSLGK
jgi:hypothetical protein